MCNGVDVYASYDGTTYTEIWVSSLGTVTFTNGTDVVNKVAHGLSNGTEIKFSVAWTMPTGLTDWQYYYIVNANTDDFQLSLTLDWPAIDFTTDGTGTITAKLSNNTKNKICKLSSR